jgi:hypothetical protein
MASSSSDDEDEAMAGLSLKNGRASTRGGLLGGDLAQLDIPPNARLCGVNMSVDEDGTKVWTVTFKAKPKPARRKQRPGADGQLQRLFPLRCKSSNPNPNPTPTPSPTPSPNPSPRPNPSPEPCPVRGEVLRLGPRWREFARVDARVRHGRGLRAQRGAPRRPTRAHPTAYPSPSP